MRVNIITDERAARIANILGPACAMAMAIKDRDERRSRGLDAHIFELPGKDTLLVGPMPGESVGK